MDARKRLRLERLGYTVGDYAHVLGLSPAERTLVEIRASLADAVHRRRVAAGLTQAQVAKLAGSSQARIARVEAADASVALDLLIRTLLALGATGRDVPRAIARAS